LTHQSRIRERDELLQGRDAETLQSLDHEGIHRENRNGTGGKEGGKLGIRHQDRLTWLGPGCRYPGTKFSGGSAHTGGGNQGAGENPKESLEGNNNLVERGAVEAFQTVHPHKNTPPTGGLHDGTQSHEGFHHLLLSRVVVGRIRLQKSQGRAERDGLGNQLTRPNTCFSSSLRDLPQRSQHAFSRREEGYGSGIQLRSTNQLQPKLEGG